MTFNNSMWIRGFFNAYKALNINVLLLFKKAFLKDIFINVLLTSNTIGYFLNLQI